MHVFIDESGSFSGFGATGRPSLSAVGALSIPDASMPLLHKKYEKLRAKLPQEQGEVKGRRLGEKEVAAVVSMLIRNHAIFELTVTDAAAHTERGISAYRDELAAEMERRKSRFNSDAQRDVEDAVRQIRMTSPQLFLQALATMDVLERVLTHTTLYYSQRQPKELASFKWVADSKDRDRTTDWERWWSTYCVGVLATRSKTRPGIVLEGSDYSYFDAVYGTNVEGEEGTDLKLLLSNFRFSSAAEFGLELIDILTNAVKRALTGNLARDGWGGIPRLMIHTTKSYIGFMRLEGASIDPKSPPYEDVARHFTTGGKFMLSPKFSRLAEAEAEQHG